MGIADTITRIRGLLTGSIVATGRALTNDLEDWTDLSRGDRDAAAEQVERAFVLEHMGTVEDPGTVISASTLYRYEVMRLTVSRFMGAGEDTDVDFGEVQRDMGTLGEEVRNILEDPNNMNRGSTGWIDADTWVMGEPRIINGRLAQTIAFRCFVEQTVGAL